MGEAVEDLFFIAFIALAISPAVPLPDFASWSRAPESTLRNSPAAFLPASTPGW
jgi:hypothetical protein